MVCLCHHHHFNSTSNEGNDQLEQSFFPSFITLSLFPPLHLLAKLDHTIAVSTTLVRSWHSTLRSHLMLDCPRTHVRFEGVTQVALRTVSPFRPGPKRD
jgi:hypothetical protein